MAGWDVALSKAMLSDAPGLISQPGLVGALQSGQAGSFEVRAVNQFVQGLELNKQVQLARASGGQLNLSTADKATLDGLGITYGDIDATRAVVHPPDPAQAAKAAGGFLHGLERFGGKVAQAATNNWLFTNPVSEKLFAGMSRASDIAMTPSRTGMSGGLLGAMGVNTGPLGKPIVPGAAGIQEQNAAENQQQMKTHGYSSGFFSTLAFYSHGEQTYSDMSHLRDQFGATSVDDAVQYLEATKGGGDYTKQLYAGKSADDSVRITNQLNDPEFQTLVKLVDSHHLSPGRELAASIGVKPGDKIGFGGLLIPGGPKVDAYNLMSGSLDAAATWYADPMLAAGKGVAAYKVASIGLRGALDSDGVRKILDPLNRNLAARMVQRGMRSFLVDARLANSEDQVVAAAATARIRARTPELEPLIADVAGKSRVHQRGVEGDWVLTSSKPINTYDELTDHLVHTDAMLRMGKGLAANEKMLMPGAVGIAGYRRLKALAAGRATVGGLERSHVATNLKTGEKERVSWIDLRDRPSDFIPVPGASAGSAIPDDVAEAAVANAGTSEAGLRGQALLNERRYGKWVAPDSRSGKAIAFFSPGALASRSRYAAQRVGNILPTESRINYADPGSVNTVYRFALTFMPKAEANLLATQYLRGDEATRMSVARGILDQTVHAAGLPASGTGRAIYKKVIADADSEANQAFSTVKGADTYLNPAKGENVRAGLWDGHLATGLEIPNFQEMHRYAAKAGLYDHLTRKIFETGFVDQVTGILKPAWMFTGSNFTRAILEDFMGVATRGQVMDWSRSRAAVKSRRLLNSTFDDAAEAKSTLRQVGGSIGRAVLVKKMRGLVDQGWAGTDEDLLRTANRLGTDEVNEVLEHLTGSYNHMAMNPGEFDKLREINGAGFEGRGLWYRYEKAGYGPQTTDGGRGAALWSINLQQRLTGSGLGEHALAMVLDPNLSREEKIARHADYLASDRATEFRERAQRAAFTKTGTPVTKADGSTDEVAKATALRDLAGDQLDDMASQVSHPDGTINEHLTDYLMAHGRAPSAAWIEKTIPDAHRPSFALGPEWIPTLKATTAADVSNAIRGLGQVAFDKVIAGPVNSVTRSPVFLMNMKNAEKNLLGYKEKLMEQGMTDAAAERVLNQTIAQQAYHATVKQVDDPALRTQLDVIGRNFVPFIRATNDFLRRWGRTFREDPARLRKAQLMYEGGVHSGFITYDAEGHPQFTYPGSGYAINAMLKAGQFLGLPKAGISLVMMPVMSNMSTQVTFLNQSLDNPLSYSVSPLVSTPVNYLVSKLFPGSELGQRDLDTIMRGQLGAGRPWWDSFLPTVLRRGVQFMDTDDRDSMLASAVRNAMVHMDASGRWEVNGQTLPEDASPEQQEKFIADIKTGSRNQLFVRLLFAMFAPGAPSADMTVPDKEASDPIYRAQGVGLLEDEFRKMVNDMDGDWGKALAVWTAIHPDKLAYSVASSEVAGKSGVIPATRESMQWMQEHKDFLTKYKAVGGYFVPITHGDFNPQAWQGQFEMDLRNHKDIAQFYQDVRVRGAEQTYYDAKDVRDKAVNEAVASGDKDAARVAKESFTLWSKTFLPYNPLFQDKLAQWSVNQRQAENAQAQLESMLGDKTVPDMPELGGVRDMLDATSNHNAYRQSLSGVRSAQATAVRQAEQDAYEKYMQGVVAQYPGLKDLYNGVFRTLDKSKLAFLEGE